MGIANLDEKYYSPMLVNEFHSGLLLRSDKYENPHTFNHEALYTFIDGHVVNELYSRLLLRSDKYENPPTINHEALHTFIDGHERIITESNLGKLIGCEFYRDVFEALRHYQTDNVWDTMAREPGCKKVAFNLKSLPLRFLHHFIASSIQCRTRAFTRLTTDDI